MRAHCLRVFVACICVCCAPPAPPAGSILDQNLESGGNVSDLLDGNQPTVILVYTAATCLACNTPLPIWENLATAGRVELVLLLDGSLSEADRKVMRIRRIPVAGVLSGSGWPANKLPSEYLISKGNVVATAEGGTQVYERKLWEHPLVSPASDTAGVQQVPASP